MSKLRWLLAMVLSLGVFVLLSACQARQASPSMVSDYLPVAASNLQINDFTLTDQNGKAFRYLENPPKLTLMTFIYTHCTDVCPFVAIKMNLAYQILGDKADNVRLVAVTTDPERDTVSVIAAYCQALGLSKGWAFLTGSQTEVQTVWRDFKIAVSKTDEAEAIETARNASELGLSLPDDRQVELYASGLPNDAKNLGEEIVGKFGGGYDVAHSVPFWIVDNSGNLLALLGPETSPADLAKELLARL